MRSMSEAIGVSPAFLSSVETGREKVPEGFVDKVLGFFGNIGHSIDAANLRKTAMLSNDNVPLNKLHPVHRMLVAGFASSDLTSEQLKRIEAFFDTIHKSRKGKRNG
jgi:hypothetical protein